MRTVRTDIELVKSLKGLRVAADATLISGGRVIDRQSGGVQFTDNGALSGICTLDLSAKAAEDINNGEISLDTAPTLGEAELYGLYQKALPQ